jgi:hypothetical protein
MKTNYSSRYLMVLATSVALCAAAAPKAHADLSLELKSGAQTIIIPDNATFDLSSAPGVIVYSGSIGSFSINITTGVSNPSSGSLTQPVLDLNSIDVSGGAGTLEILLSESGFGPSSASLLAQIGGTVNNNGGSLVYKTFDDPGNGLFAETNQVTLQGPFGPGAFSNTATSGALVLGSPYSLTEDVTITHTAGGSSSFDGEASIGGQTGAIPEPNSLMLAAAGLVGFAAWRVRRIWRLAGVGIL